MDLGGIFNPTSITKDGLNEVVDQALASGHHKIEIMDDAVRYAYGLSEIRGIDEIIRLADAEVAKKREKITALEYFGKSVVAPLKYKADYMSELLRAFPSQEPKLKWAEFKKTLKVNKARVVVTQDGEVVVFVKGVQQDRKFEVK